MNNEYDRSEDPSFEAPMSSGSHITLGEQIEIDTELTELQRRYDALIEKVYIMGYTKGLLHRENTPYFP